MSIRLKANMTEIPLTKINYDDFYKFVTSLSVLAFLVLVFIASYITTFTPIVPDPIKKLIKIAFFIYFGLACISGILFIWACKKWYARQKLFDKQLVNEITLQKTEIQNKKLDGKLQKRKLSETELSFGSLLNNKNG